MKQIIFSFYKFVPLEDWQEKQPLILAKCQAHEIKGTILLAHEGINGNISSSRQQLEAIMSFLRQDPRLEDLEVKESSTDAPPFEHLKVRLKKEIVTLGMPEINPNQQVGTYVNAQEWNQLINDPEVIVIDTRNDYEVSIGTFKNAINPQTESFREFPDYVHNHLDGKKEQKIALFCTGGIRCEKATSFMLSQGFKQVYHLKGGILKYLETVSPQESLWKGECFVFDQRVAVKHSLEIGNYDFCHSCGYPISEDEKKHIHYQEGISCPYCFADLTPEKKARQQEKQKQRQLAKKRQQAQKSS